MSVDIFSAIQHIALLAAIYAVLWVWVRIDRLVLGWGAIILFCTGQYGWAFVAFWFWSGAELAHRRFMAKQRAAGLYNGPWIP